MKDVRFSGPIIYWPALFSALYWKTRRYSFSYIWSFLEILSVISRQNKWNTKQYHCEIFLHLNFSIEFTFSCETSAFTEAQLFCQYYFSSDWIRKHLNWWIWIWCFRCQILVVSTLHVNLKYSCKSQGYRMIKVSNIFFWIKPVLEETNCRDSPTCQISEMDLLAKRVKSWKLLSSFIKSSIFHVWHILNTPLTSLNISCTMTQLFLSAIFEASTT